MRTTFEEVKAYVEEHTPRWEAGGLPVTNWAWVGSTFINGEGDDIIVLSLGADIHSKRWSDFNLVYGGSDDEWVSTKDAMGHNVIFITDPDYFDRWEAARLRASTFRICLTAMGTSHSGRIPASSYTGS